MKLIKSRVRFIVAMGLALVLGVSGMGIAASSHTQVGYGADAKTKLEVSVFTKDKKPIENAFVTIDSPGAFETTYRTEKTGIFTAMVPCKTDKAKSITHKVVVTHDKHKTVNATFTTTDGKCGEPQKLTIQMDPK
jgi:hypothetical protein